MILILAAIATVYIVLGILYESYVHPLTILSTLPSAGVGALLALSEIFGTDLPADPRFVDAIESAWQQLCLQGAHQAVRSALQI